jgi:hypothetical protein
MTIIYAFDHVLTERGFGVNVGHLVFTLLKIAVSLWILMTDSDKNECVLKWQAKLMFIISGIVGCLAGGVTELTRTGDFYAMFYIITHTNRRKPRIYYKYSTHQTIRYTPLFSMHSYGTTCPRKMQ